MFAINVRLSKPGNKLDFLLLLNNADRFIEMVTSILKPKLFGWNKAGSEV